MTSINSNAFMHPSTPRTSTHNLPSFRLTFPRIWDPNWKTKLQQPNHTTKMSKTPGGQAASEKFLKKEAQSTYSLLKSSHFYYDCRCTMLTVLQNMVKARRMHPAIQRVVSQAKHQWRQTQGAQIRESPRAQISLES